MNEQLFIDSVNLPKWPALIVMGEAITEDQALEIIFRTSSTHLYTNDRDFRHQIRSFFGIEKDSWDYHEKTSAAFHTIDGLEYLENHQLISSWVGGKHGWCNWDGEIFANTYNIGKYPSAREVYNEWIILAEAFSFLNLRCQLMGGEVGDENTSPQIEYIVKKGTVKAMAPSALLFEPSDRAFKSNAFFTDPNHEHIPFDQFLSYYQKFCNIMKSKQS
jgi:hypothetical protein